MLIIYFLLVLFVYVYYLYLWYKYKPVGNVAVLPYRAPIIGHSYLLKNDVFDILMALGKHSVQNNGINAAYLLGPVPVYVISDPIKATVILSTCLEKMFVYKLINPLFGDTLVSASVPTWKRNRRILDLAFKPQVLEAYMSVFNIQGLKLLQEIDAKAGRGYVDVTEKITRNVLETTCQTTLGKLPEDRNYVTESYVKALHKVFEIVTMRVQKPWMAVDPIFNICKARKELDEALKEIHDTSAKMVALRKSEYLERVRNKHEITEKGRDVGSFLDIVIESSSSTKGSLFTDLQLRYLCDNILLAAFDTSTYELLFTLLCIGSDPEVQRKICQEIDEVVGKEKTVLKEHLRKLNYLEAAIKEAVRLYPIGPVVGRQATSDLQLDDVTLPAGSLFVVHLWAINRNPQFWGADADQYKPDRWLDADTLPEHPNAFGSFSFGKRNCIGKNYALMHMKTTLVHILRKYRIRSDYTKIELSCYIMIKVKSGHLMKFELR